MTTNQHLLNFRLADLLKFHLPKTWISAIDPGRCSNFGPEMILK
jgi:hypothetical protein